MALIRGKQEDTTLNKKDTFVPQEMKLSDEDRHRFLNYLMPQLEPLRQACEHNWLTQAGLIALAGFHLYRNSTPIAVFGLTFTNEVLDIVFPLVLTYLVIRLGYLLNAYIYIRTGITRALSKFGRRPVEFQKENAERMLRANSLVELFCLDYKWSKGIWKTRVFWSSLALLILPLILSGIFAFNHILAVLYVERIAGYARGPAIALGVVLGVAMASCYLHFISTTEKTGAKFISISTIVFTIVGYFFVHHKMASGAWW